jgi:NADH:ubiquinone oxidoreductase subunit E
MVDKKKFKSEIERIKKETGSVVVALQFCMDAEGYITKDAVEIISDVFGQSRCAVYSTATFYHQFSFTPKGKYVISVCMGTACFVCGAADLMKAIEEELGIKEGGVTEDQMFSIAANTRCVGDCAQAPIVLINDLVLNKTTIQGTLKEIRKIRALEKKASGA